MNDFFHWVGDLFKAAIFTIVIWVIGVGYLGYLLLIPYLVIATIGLLFIRPTLHGKRSLFEAIKSLLKFFMIGTFKVGFIAIPFVPCAILYHNIHSDYRVSPDDFWNIGTIVFIVFDLILAGATFIFARAIYNLSDGHPWEQFKDSLRGTY